MTSKKKVDIIRNLILLFIFFAICGWIYEVIWTYFDDGVWTNRGFLFGPKQIKKPVYIGKLNVRFLLLFVYICLITTVVELGATYIIELFGSPFTVLWDYSDHFMNFQGRICLDASARFGVLGLMIIYGALPLYNKLIAIKNQKALNITAWIIIGLFVFDWIMRIPFGNNYTGPV